jgi:hypothetical protein
VPRRLSDDERAGLLYLLDARDFRGRDALRAQVDFVYVVDYCECPCASIELVVEPGPPPAAGHVPTRATVYDEDGQLQGEVRVRLANDYLWYIEVTSHTGDPIYPFPPVQRLVID